MKRKDNNWEFARLYFKLITMSLPKKLVREDSDLINIREIISKYGDDNMINSVSTDSVLQGSIKNRSIYVIVHRIMNNQIIKTWYNISRNCHFNEETERYSDDIYVQLSCYNDPFKGDKVCTYEKKDDCFIKTTKTKEGNKDKTEEIYFDLRGNPIYVIEESTGKTLALKNTSIINRK